MRNPGRPIDPAEAKPDLLSPALTYCPMCTIPMYDTWPYCFACKTARETLPAAELPIRLAFLTYAGATRQSLTDVYEYKNDPPSRSAQIRLSVVMYLFTGIHGRCLLASSQHPINAVVTVPSGRGRSPHPLDNFLRYFPDEWKTVRAAYQGPPRNGRATAINPELFQFSRPINGEHILILEDSWVQGKNALGMAASAYRNGAVEVTVVSIARMLDRAFGANAPWLATTVATSLYDPFFCPVTRGTCPP